MKWWEITLSHVVSNWLLLVLRGHFLGLMDLILNLI